MWSLRDFQNEMVTASEQSNPELLDEIRLDGSSTTVRRCIELVSRWKRRTPWLKCMYVRDKIRFPLHINSEDMCY